MYGTYYGAGHEANDEACFEACITIAVTVVRKYLTLVFDLHLHCQSLPWCSNNDSY